MEEEYQQSIELFESLRRRYEDLYDQCPVPAEPAMSLIRDISNDAKYIYVLEHRMKLRKMTKVLAAAASSPNSNFSRIDLPIGLEAIAKGKLVSLSDLR